MTHLTRSCAVFLFAMTLSGAPPGALAIRNARVVPVSGPELKRGTVIIRDGLIEAVGDNVAVPAGAWVMEGEGLTVYPGLIDALSNWGIPDTAAPAATTSSSRSSRSATPAPSATEEPASTVNSQVRAADLVKNTDRKIEAARAAGFTSAVTFPSRGIFAGQGAVINLAGEKAGQMVVQSPVAQYLTFATSMGSFPNSLMGVYALIRQTYLDAAYYRDAQQRYAANAAGAKRPEYDRTLEGVLETKRALLPATRAVEVERVLKLASGLKDVQPVLYGLHEGYRAADRLKAAGVPALVSLKWPERSRDADPDDVESFRTLQLRDKAPSTPAALAKAGVKFALYSDGTERPRDLMKAVKRAIDAGLSPQDALRAMTLSPAEIYGVAGRMGSIEAGKIANLLVTDGDLFQEKTQVKFVLIDGVKYEPLPESGDEAVAR